MIETNSLLKYLALPTEKRQIFLMSQNNETLNSWRISSEDGDPEACFFRGEMFEFGIGEHQDDSTAIKWFQAAAEQGLAVAQHIIGKKYLEGKGCQESPKNALKWFKKAAEQGYTAAQNNIGTMYYNGLGVEKSYKEGLTWIKLAATNGSPTAQYNLGVLYAAGENVEKSEIEATKWLRLAADQGNVDAIQKLDELLLDVRKSVPENGNGKLTVNIRQILNESLQILKMLEFIKSLPQELARTIANSIMSESVLFAAIDNEVAFFEFLLFFPIAMISAQLKAKTPESTLEETFFSMRDAYSQMLNLMANGHTEADVIRMLRDVTQESYTQVLSQVAQQGAALQMLRQTNGGEISGLSELKAFDSENGTFHLDTFRILLSRLAEIIVKADGEISATEQELLKAFKTRLFAEDLRKTTSSSIKQKMVDGKTATDELHQLIGLGRVKKEVQSLINYLAIQKQRKAKGLPSPDLTLHFVFTGAPGTGKTTVARIIGKILCDLGFLKKGHLVEAARQDMVAGFVGQTAIKTSEKIDAALDGILFIDEAYTLASSEKANDFGQEAIETLLKRMEDNRDRLAVIVAGYSDEMKDFVQANPGLQSRFTRYIHFDDYTPLELCQIVNSMADHNQYKISSEATSFLEKEFERQYEMRGKTFGNGRLVRNIFQKAIQKQADRIVNTIPLDDEVLVTLVSEDFQ